MSPWDGASNYQYPPGTEGVPDTTIESDKYNSFIADLRDEDLNKARPIHRGGTGATTAAAARTNLKAETALTDQIVTNYDAQVWQNGGFVSNPGATGSPDGAGGATNWYVGTAWTDGNVIVLEARNGATGTKYTRSKVGAGAWTSWGIVGAGQFVLKTGDTMTGNLGLNVDPWAVLTLNSFATDPVNRWSGLSLAHHGAMRFEISARPDEFAISRFADNGDFIDDAFIINRASGALTVKGNLTVNAATINAVAINGVAGAPAIVHLISVAGQAAAYRLGPAANMSEIYCDAAGNFSINITGAVTGVFSVMRSGAVANTLVLVGGKVGIGTASPGVKLEVADDVAFYRAANPAIGLIYLNQAKNRYIYQNGTDFLYNNGVDRTVYHTGNLNPNALPYLPLTGGTTTGQITIQNGAGSQNGTLYLGNNGAQIYLHYDSIRYILGGGAYNNRTSKLLVASGLFDSIDVSTGVCIRGHDDATAGLWTGYSNNATNTSNIRALGQFESYSNSYGAISDRTLKENITPATPKLEEVLRVPIINFEFNNEMREPLGKQIGVADNDIAAIWPSLVYRTPVVKAKEIKQIETKDGMREEAIDLPDIGGYNCVKSSVLFGPIMLKAFQEFVAETRQRLEALES